MLTYAVQLLNKIRNEFNIFSRFKLASRFVLAKFQPIILLPYGYDPTNVLTN